MPMTSSEGEGPLEVTGSPSPGRERHPGRAMRAITRRRTGRCVQAAGAMTRIREGSWSRTR